MPFGVVTVTSNVLPTTFVTVGVSVVISVSETMVKLEAAVPLKSTAVAPAKLAPIMVMGYLPRVDAEALSETAVGWYGVTDEIVGSGVAAPSGAATNNVAIGALRIAAPRTPIFKRSLMTSMQPWV